MFLYRNLVENNCKPFFSFPLVSLTIFEISFKPHMGTKLSYLHIFWGRLTPKPWSLDNSSYLNSKLRYFQILEVSKLHSNLCYFIPPFLSNPRTSYMKHGHGQVLRMWHVMVTGAWQIQKKYDAWSWRYNYARLYVCAYRLINKKK